VLWLNIQFEILTKNLVSIKILSNSCIKFFYLNSKLMSLSKKTWLADNLEKIETSNRKGTRHIDDFLCLSHYSRHDWKYSRLICEIRQSLRSQWDYAYSVLLYIETVEIAFSVCTFHFCWNFCIIIYNFMQRRFSALVQCLSLIWSKLLKMWTKWPTNSRCRIIVVLYSTKKRITPKGARLIMAAICRL
jgi:hypothetical protein